MGGKEPNQQPKPAGIDELKIPTAETNVPPTWFAGVTALNVSWIMDPLITQVITVTQGK